MMKSFFKKYWKEIVIIFLQATAMLVYVGLRYLTNPIGVFVNTFIFTFIFSVILGSVSTNVITFAFPFIVSILYSVAGDLFFDDAVSYFGGFYLLGSLIGIGIGSLIKLIFNKIKRKKQLENLKRDEAPQ